MANQPHIVKPAAAPLQNFVTDMAAPLKECKVYFEPVQEGEGDPSPDNVRAITGWTNLGIMHKNGLPSEYQAVEYLQSTGTQFITGYFTPLAAGIITLKVILEPESMNDNLWYCGGRSNGHISMQVGKYGGTWYKDRDSDIYEVISVTNGIEKIFCSKSSNSSLSYDYLLFGRAWGGSHPYNCKIFQCTLYFNDIPIYNYIPCYRKIDNVAGMYDTVNNVFYTNEGTGTFIIGQDIQALPRPLLFESTHSFDWGATLGTIYGGYVDLVTGEVWKTYYEINITELGTYRTLGINKNNNTQVSWFLSNHLNAPDATGYVAYSRDGYCSCAPFLVNNYYWDSKCQVNNSTADLIIEGELTAEEVDTWIKAHAPIQIVYPLKTPQLITTLTSTTLKTLRGANNIWSNSNGDITVQFWRH